MITNAEVIYEFKQMTDKHHVSDDTGWSDSWILWYLLRNRAYLVHQKSKQMGRVSRFSQMTTPCMELIPAENCPCVPPTDCIALMTKIPIPRGITGIISVTNPDNTVVYPQTESSKIKYRSQQRFKSLADATTWFSEDEGNGTRIYIFSEKPLKYIKATLIPENPIEIQRMVDCDGKTPNECVSNYDLQWKLDSDLTKVAMDMALQSLQRSRGQLSDIKNNGIDDNIANKNELIGSNS